ncbi:MAG: hypothetical protein J6U73_05770 [Alistipes sp.]|nr:hypothetical protein [Alistipes sp.]
MCLIIILIFLIIGWFINDPVSAGIVLGIVIIAGIIYALVDSQNSKEAQEAEEKKRQQRAEDKKRAEESVQRSIGQLSDKYGRLSNTIRLEKWGDMPDIKKCLLVFGESELLYIDGREVLFKDIISYSITDDYRIKHGEVEYTSETNTSTGSLLGRSAAGAVLGGGVGAVIGASSASKNTTTIGIQKDDTIIHKYSLSINVRSLENPLIRMNLGDSTKKAEEVNAIFAYIIASKEA